MKGVYIPEIEALWIFLLKLSRNADELHDIRMREIVHDVELLMHTNMRYVSLRVKILHERRI